jgi:ABC-type multidrug transport system fused ATPase/permease subunit
MKFVSTEDMMTTYKILNKNDKKILMIVIFLQLILNFLDLIGIALFGLLGALAVNGISFKTPGTRSSQVLEFLNIDGLTFQFQVGILGIVAATILIAKTLIAMQISRKTLTILGLIGARTSATLFKNSMQSDYLFLQQYTNVEWYSSLVKGVNQLTLKIIANVINLFTDIFLLIVLIGGMIFFNFQIAFLTVLVFGFTGFILFRATRSNSRISGFLEQEYENQIALKISESINAYKEVYLRNSQDVIAREISTLRKKQVKSQTVAAFVPMLSKYVFEAVIVVGTLLVAGVQFLLFDATQAVATLSIFIVASSRIAPAVLRIQLSVVLIKTSFGASSSTLDLIRQNMLVESGSRTKRPLDRANFTGNIELVDVTFTYPENEKSTLNGINLTIPPGNFCAIVGPTGSGKSTLVDVVLGLLEPNSGCVYISARPAKDAVISWPGAIAYVPQKVAIFNATIRYNLLLSGDEGSYSDESIWEALQSAELYEFVSTLPGKLDFKILDFGSNLSGGQIQRLGIARALLTKPSVVILDESTSALDGITEASISKSISSLGDQITRIVIAHRLSTILDADEVIYLDSGTILARGTFNQVRAVVPEFDAQATAMGL